MRRDLLTGFLAMVILTILLGFGYPMLVTGVSQAVFPGKANGSLIKRNGVVVGSALIGQQFYEDVIGKNGKVKMVKGVAVTQPDPRYFQTRPSATVPADNAAGSAFSNLGPNSKATGRRSAPTSRPTSAREAVRPRPDRRAGPGRRGQQLGVGRRPRHLGRQRRHPGAPDRRRPPPLAERGRRADRQVHDGPQPRLPRRARRQRARAQPRPRPEQISRCRRNPQPQSGARSRCFGVTSSRAR